VKEGWTASQTRRLIVMPLFPARGEREPRRDSIFCHVLSVSFSKKAGYLITE